MFGEVILPLSYLPTPYLAAYTSYSSFKGECRQDYFVGIE